MDILACVYGEGMKKYPNDTPWPPVRDDREDLVRAHAHLERLLWGESNGEDDLSHAFARIALVLTRRPDIHQGTDHKAYYDEQEAELPVSDAGVTEVVH